MPPELAIREYYYISTDDRQSKNSALAALRRNPRLQDFYENKLNNHSNKAADWASLQQLVKDLRVLRTEWSVSLLGKMLFDDRDVQLPEGITFGQLAELAGSSLHTIPNRERAAEALQQLDLKGAPYKRTDHLIGGSPASLNYVETWRSWWKANEAALPSLLQTNVQPTIPDKAIPDSVPVAAATSNGIAKEPHSIASTDGDWFGYLVGFSCALAGVAFAVLLRKRVKRHSHNP